MIRTPRGAVIAVVACVVIVSCGVPKQSTATRIRAKHVPFGLLDRNAGAAASETAGDAASVYFAKSGRLVAVARRLVSSAPPQDLLNLLRRGPTKGEVEAGLRSAVPNQNLARVSSVTAGTATVDLRSRFIQDCYKPH